MKPVSLLRGPAQQLPRWVSGTGQCLHSGLQKAVWALEAVMSIIRGPGWRAEAGLAAVPSSTAMVPGAVGGPGQEARAFSGPCSAAAAVIAAAASRAPWPGLSWHARRPGSPSVRRPPAADSAQRPPPRSAGWEPAPPRPRPSALFSAPSPRAAPAQRALAAAQARGTAGSDGRQPRPPP